MCRCALYNQALPMKRSTALQKYKQPRARGKSFFSNELEVAGSAMLLPISGCILVDL